MTITAPNPFQKATRAQLKARVAFEGPTGAGKTWTGLEWATVLAAGGRIAVVDTERGSASLYSDRFDFDVLAFEPPYDPGRLADILKAAEGHGYAVVVIDSLSHFWEGEGGTLDMVDAAAQRSGGNSFAGWKVGTPALRHLVDTMLGLDAHLIATMRSKMEYVLQEDSRGKKVPQKVGMAPVMRAGVEYEFTLVGDLNLEHQLVITKSRCDRLADEMVQPGRAGDAAQTFAAWLGEGEAVASKADTEALVEKMNGLPEEARRDAKQTFVARFGRPDQLRADQLADAQAFVDEIVAGSATPHPEGEGEPAPTEEEAAAEPAAVTAGGVNDANDVEGDPPAPPEPDSAESPKSAFFRLVGELTDTDDQAQALRHAVIHKATDGATTNSQQASPDALEAAVELLEQCAEGTWLVRDERLVSASEWADKERDRLTPVPDLPADVDGWKDLAKSAGVKQIDVVREAQRLAGEGGPGSLSALVGHEVAGEVLEWLQQQAAA